MVECCSLHFNRKKSESFMKKLNSGLHKPLKLSKYCIVSKMLTSAKVFVEFQCFNKKIMQSMFYPPKSQLTLNINVRKQKK